MITLIGSIPVRKVFWLAGLCLLLPILSNAQLVPAFVPAKTEGCSPLQVSFANTSSGAVSYLWDFGNGNTSTVLSPSATFITPGTYTVTLTAKNLAGLESTTTQVIRVFSNPVADFTANRTGGCVNDTVFFINQSVSGSNAITKWSWDFGDGSGSTLQAPAGHRYTFGDQFKVTLVVEDQYGCRGTLARNDYIDISDLQVDFTNTPASACNGPLSVKFTEISTPASPLYTYQWNFGNGNSSALRNDSSRYELKGSYPVSLRVTAPNGCSVTRTKNKHVVIHEPKAAFSVLNATGCQPLKANFVNLSTSADPGIATYAWSTSAGHTSTLKNPEFLFTDTGTFSVTLKMTIPGVCSDSVIKTDYIRVVPGSNSVITASGDKFCSVPAQVSFSVMPAQSNVLGWSWGDNTTSGSGNNPVKTFGQFGQFAVKAIVQNVSGCIDTVSMAGPVSIQPSGFSLGFSKKNGCAPLAVIMDAVDTGLVPMTSWQWLINGAVAGNLKSLSYSFNDTGVYVITCTGSNAQGCTLTLTDTIKAGALTYPQYTIDKQTSCASNATFVFQNQTNLTEPRADSWFWLFGDNYGGIEEEPSHIYKDTGTFKIMLTAIHKGCSTSVEHRQVSVFGPKVSFTEPVLNCSNDSLLFKATTKGGNSLLWDFGDGHYSGQANTKHKYANPGTYQVTLLARDSITGCLDTSVKTMNVPDMQVPVMAFTQSTKAMCPGSVIMLEDQSVGGDIKEHLWVFSNNQHTTGKLVTFKIQDTGYHNLQLILRDRKGCIFELRTDSVIRVYPGAVKVHISDPVGCAPLAITATDESVTTFPVTKRAWKWGTGDSSELAAATTAYTYAVPPADQKAGYTLRLEITDSMGCTYKGSHVVKPLKPAASYTSKLTKGCGYDSVVFTPASTTGGFAPFRFRWLAGTDTLSTNEQPQLRFSFPDTSFAVNLVVTDSFQCSSSFSTVIHTDARKPVAAFGAFPERILDCPGPPIFLWDSTQRGASGIRLWEWSFGDSTKSFLANPSKTYLEPGNYDVTLKITDSLHCESAVRKNSYVRIAGPVASYKIVSTQGCMPLSTSFQATSTNTRKFEWDMGDGTSDSNATYQHSYSRSGKFVPSLSITDSAGCRRLLPLADTVVVHTLPKPSFAVNKNKICAGSKIIFENNTKHDKPVMQYTWNFGDGDSLKDHRLKQVKHTYNKTGRFDVVLQATDSLGCSDTDTIPEAVIVSNDVDAPAVPAVLRSTVIDDKQVLFAFKPNREGDFERYTVYYNYNASGVATSADSSFTITDTVFIQQGIHTLHNRYFYSVTATDVCRNESARSPLHGTTELTASSAGNSVALQWSAYKGWPVSGYEIYRSDDGVNSYHPLAKVSGKETQYTDSTVRCHRSYFYKIKALEEGGNGQESWSDTSSASPTFVSTIPGTKNVRATVTEKGQVLLEWRKQVHTLTFVPVLYRSENNGEPVFYKELNTQDTFFIDTEVDVQRNSYTYITYLQDNCGALSRASNPATSILLSAELERTPRKDYNPELTWTSYIGWETGVEEYEVEFKYDSLARFTTKTSTDELSFFDRDLDEKQRKYCYRITARQKDNPAVYSRSNQVCVSTDPVMYIPTAFTPNGDGVNETFKIGGVFLEQYSMKIWNRYGELIYQSNNMLEGWDGTYRGEPVPADAYTYLVEGIGRGGTQVEAKGSVTVVR